MNAPSIRLAGIAVLASCLWLMAPHAGAAASRVEVTGLSLFRPASRPSVTLDAQDFTELSGILADAAEVAAWSADRYETAPVTGGAFRIRLRLQGGREHQVTIAARRGPGAPLLTVARVTVRLAGDVRPHVWREGSLTVEELELLTTDWSFTPAAAGDGALVIRAEHRGRGPEPPGQAPAELRFESLGAHPGFVVTAPAEAGQVHVVLPLHGPATHRILVRSGDGAGGAPLARLTVTQSASADTGPVSVRSGLLWLYEPAYSGAKYAETVPVSGRVAGSPPPAFVVISVSRAEQGRTLISTQRLPAAGGRFAGTVWLRFGPGRYHISIAAEDPAGRLEPVAEFTAVQVSPRDLRYLAPSPGVESDAEAIRELAGRLTAGGGDPAGAGQAGPNPGDSLTRARAIYTWVTRSIAYDTGARPLAPASAADTLRLRSANCRGYALLTIALLRAAGIPAREALGAARAGDAWVPHSWAEAYAGGRWISLDPTWDSGYVANGRFVAAPGLRYFDPPAAQFTADHRLDRYGL